MCVDVRSTVKPALAVAAHYNFALSGMHTVTRGENSFCSGMFHIFSAKHFK